jgi:SAM-dependent methyltransferase
MKEFDKSRRSTKRKASFCVACTYTWIIPVVMNSPEVYKTNNIYVPGLSRPDQLPEIIGRLPDERYTPGRNKDYRLYSDEMVARLPAIAAGHPHYQEWRRREKSCRRLVRYLADKKLAPGILDVECGNGWLSAQLSTVPGSKVIGIDPDLTGLQQAARVFHRHPNLKFIYGDFCSDVLYDLSFDIVIFAGSIQYFPSLRGIIESALLLLRPGGEIHILDSPFRQGDGHTSAASRSTTAPLNDDHTFHHHVRDLYPFRHRYMYNPRSFWRRMLANRNPCPWICISKEYPL